jgi:signal transduction histidine kinase/CheY-like chemotaxis protein/HAMP domain-containing protein
MKIEDIKISSQLRMGLGLILAFVLFLGLLSWKQNDLLWLQTKTLYDHPLQVSRAIGELKADISALRMNMRDLILAAGEKTIANDLGEIEAYKSDISRQLSIITDRYSGPKEHVTGLQDELAKWNAYHEETIRLVRAKRTSEAMARTTASNADGGLTRDLMTRIRTLSDFAGKMSDDCYSQAAMKNESLDYQLAAVVLIILVLSLSVSWYLLKNLRVPLQQLTSAAEQFRRGKLGVRSEYCSKNEFGILSATFNAMADTVETQMRISERADRITDVMLREEDSHNFCRELIRELIEQTDSRMGAVYLLNPSKTEFELFESIGLSEHGRDAFSALTPEGEFGAALASKKMQRIIDIPADTRFVFSTADTTILPREIITLPLVSGQETVAVISLASIHGYDHAAILLLETILDTLIARMNGILAFRQVRDLAERLDRKNVELNAQQQELASQADELASQNSELLMQKKELDTANRLKSMFLSNMSHELRTPLNSVIALSVVLGRRLKAKISAEELRYLEVIERNGRDLLTLINGILDLSRIESGREEISLTRFSLEDLIGEIAEMMNPLIEEKGIVFNIEVGVGLPHVTSDAGKVRHILQNLIANAVKFTENGSVEVSARQVDNEVHVTVQDTGIGIAADHISHIFEEFRQADEGTSRKYGGTGLGLTIAKKYALLLHGDIEVESTVGRGSVFTLRLPFSAAFSASVADAASVPDHDRRKTAAPQTIRAGNGQCLLVVEDSEPAAIQLIDILSEQGYRVQVAENGREALAKINDYPPAAVILDLMMPEMDGFEVLRQIRSSEKTALLPVLILTAKHISKEELNFLTGNHIYQLIQKGDISKNELLAAVAEMVATPDSAAPETSPPVRTYKAEPPCILVVEDNPDNLMTIRAILDNIYRIETAVNGLQALEQARLYRPDLILMDLALPLMDGFAALEHIRNDEELAGISVLAVTASAMTGDREKILARGFDGYISKPIEEQEVKKALHRILYGIEYIENISN